MRVGVVDVGSNTVRLLVAEPRDGVLTEVRAEKAYVGLAAEIMRRGEIGKGKLDEAGEVARRFARIARKCRVAHLESIVTAPGRQAPNADALVQALARATGAPVRVLSAEEEGILAWEGAVAAADGPIDGAVAVCDVGGGSSELVVGTPPDEPVWARSVDVGALRLQAGYLPDDPPTEESVEAAIAAVAEAFAGITPPLPRVALAAGGTARAVGRIVGRTLEEEDLALVVRLLRKRPSAKIAKTWSLDPARARTLIAGTLVLAEIQRRVGVPLTVARAGLREGAALALVAELAAA
jgi:exopolyphosphatase/guanosine-5'-triphosphate,3'-diphosphate pyrophosphatase